MMLTCWLVFYRLKTAFSWHFVDSLSLTFSFSTKKQTTCGMAVHSHWLVKSSSEFWLDYIDEKYLISVTAQVYKISQ